ncbi:MAG TPA: hypothetical protein VGL35_06655 [Rhizomicrobium sp.]|jgi:hypothetical protein
MNARNVLLAATSVIALIAGSASAAGLPTSLLVGKSKAFEIIPKGSKILYSQDSNYTGIGVDSQNFTSTTATGFNDQGADDFIIPKGKIWTIRDVDVSGIYFNGPGPANSENVIFYTDSGGMPGNPIGKGTFTNLNGSGSPSFRIKLPGNGLRLKSGHYWVSVIANLDFKVAGEWGWGTNANIRNDPAMWREPNCGWSCCPNWETLSNCLGVDYDFIFELRGISKRE